MAYTSIRSSWLGINKVEFKLVLSTLLTVALSDIERDEKPSKVMEAPLVFFHTQSHPVEWTTKVESSRKRYVEGRACHFWRISCRWC